MKKVLSLVLVLTMVLGSFSFAFAAEPTDNERVNKLVELGIVQGDEGGLRPDDTIKRSEVTVLVAKALGLEEVAKASNYASNFSDVNSHWAQGYINVAAGRGIVKGYPDGTFKPEAQISYSEIITMMVQMVEPLTEEELKLPWPANVITKATKLGLLKDVAIGNFKELATREKVFEIVYNAIHSKDSKLFIVNTLEGIVVENYRTESLKKDDVVLHVMKDQVQRSEESKYYEQGDEYKLTLTPELKAKGLDVETLLGKVVTVSFDKAGKVVSVEVNNDYTYRQGLLEEVDAKEVKLDGKYYTVGKDEARAEFDERLYQVYYNNEDFIYDKGDKAKDDFIDQVKETEFARITERNGKVLFIEAFDFEDIAPVAKDIDAKDKVAYYNDEKDGELDSIEIDEDAYVITFEKDEMKLGNYKDIEANDVIHWYEDEHENVTVFVRPAADNMVEGEYEEANAKKAKDAADIKIVLDDKEYPAEIDTENRNPVYSTITSEYSFYTLTEDYDEELASFEEEEVTLLLDMFGNVQLIGSEIVSGKFYSVISNIKHEDVRLVYADQNAWFETDRDTKFKGVGTGSKDSQLNRFDVEDLVLVSASEDLIKEMQYLGSNDDADPIVKISKDVIDFGGNYYYYIAKNAPVFVTAGDGTPKAMDIAAFLKGYYDPADKAWNAEKHALEGYVVVDEKDVDVAEAVVITKATAIDDDTDDFVAKVTRVRMRGEDYYLSLEQADGTATTHLVDNDDAIAALKDKEIVKGDIIEVTYTDDDAQDITEIVELIDVETEGTFKVTKLGRDKARGERYVVLRDKDGEEATLWLTKDAEIFGDYSVGSIVAIGEIGDYNTIDLIYETGDKVTGDFVEEPEEPEEPEVTANVTYNTLSFGPSTIYKVTVNSVTGLNVTHVTVAEMPKVAVGAELNAPTTGSSLIVQLFDGETEVGTIELTPVATATTVDVPVTVK